MWVGHAPSVEGPGGNKLRFPEAGGIPPRRRATGSCLSPQPAGLPCSGHTCQPRDRAGWFRTTNLPVHVNTHTRAAGLSLGKPARLALVGPLPRAPPWSGSRPQPSETSKRTTRASPCPPFPREFSPTSKGE